MEFVDNHLMTFPHKGYGRIFVENESDILMIKEIIREMDEFEFGYLPADLIAVFSEENMHSVYTHKFDDLNMTKVMFHAWSKGVKCFCVFGKIAGWEDF